MVDHMLHAMLKPYLIELALTTRNKTLFDTVTSPSWRACEIDPDDLARFDIASLQEVIPDLTTEEAFDRLFRLHQSTEVSNTRGMARQLLESYARQKIEKDSLPYHVIVEILSTNALLDRIHIHRSTAYLNYVIEIRRDGVSLNGREMVSVLPFKDTLIQEIKSWILKTKVIHLALR